MRKITLIAMCLVCALCACAETIVLRTGARVKGEIVFQNDEVVIVRNADGARFQYMRSDVAEIMTADVEEEKQEQAVETDNIGTSKKASILLELAGGAACIPGQSTGGAFSADLLVGSHHIGNRHLFVGGGLGYHGMFIGSEQYNFLPIKAALRIPFLEQKHSPVFGVGLGYGIALSKNYKGGLYADIDFGYRCQLNEKTAVSVVFTTQFQQAKLRVVETVDEIPFANNVGRYLVMPALKFALYF